ncbi:MAG: nicotinate phosphoribosyltransferase [Patescibacteria group bacterium]
MGIIHSLLDIDFYKLTMAQVAWKHFRNVPVTYGFKNRTISVPLALWIRREDLEAEFESVRRLCFTEEEIAYLRESEFIKRGLFGEEFLEFLKNLKLPPVIVKIRDEQFQIEVGGAWSEAIFWETIILGIVNELYYQSLEKMGAFNLSDAYAEGVKRLGEKIKILQDHPNIKIIEFGTRRRFSRDWQKYVLSELAKNVPDQLLGTSNTLLAKELGLRPIGTFAHEMYMVFSGIFSESDEVIRASHNKVLEMWRQEYGESLSIALTDTYGSDFFFRDFTKEQAQKWRGLRQDSGDPIVFGEKAIAFYERLSIDPCEKLIVFSDGLDINAIVKIADHFSGRIQIAFGWGTNLTNDLGLKALSLVVKVTEANGFKTVKLSDNLAKVTGSPEDIERFKRIFGYAGAEFQPTIY